MPRPRWWKEYYAIEREALDLESLFQSAPHVALPANGALIFPHTRLKESGHLTAAVAQAIVDSGCDTVLAIGVLHGVKRDTNQRGIHTRDGLAKDEFSLDNFASLLQVAANRANKNIPRLIARYPLLSGNAPESLPGFEELQHILRDGAALIATADMIHHGAGYDTPEEKRLDVGSKDAMGYARTQIAQQLWHLAEHDFAKFELACTEARSDFRDAGPVVAALLDEALSTQIHDLTLVDYAETLEAPQPTWVAAALAELALPILDHR
jgi:hypothetical protein